MDRREFIAAAGTVAAVASTSQAFAQMAAEEAEEPMMHSPKYTSLEKAAAHCVATGNDCLRHCLGMYKMKDTSMAGCADTAFQLVAACGALAALAAVNSEHTGHLAKAVAMVCRDCQKECEKYPKVAECKACGDSCKACAAECDKAA
jgi:Cys-rich four helix bundle protein (predicted Tat secretion target)